MKISDQLSIFESTQAFLLAETRRAFSLPPRKRFRKAQELDGRVRQLQREWARFQQLLENFK